MAKEFYLRLVAVFFVMLSISFLIASVSILPSFLLSYTEKNLIDAKLESQKEEVVSVPDQNTLMTIKDLKNKLTLVENIKKDGFFSQKILNEIILKKMPVIKITEIFYQDNGKAGQKINISGQAPSREILLLFRRALEDDVAFSKVDLPISNFVKGSNIKFNLSLIPS